MQKKVDCSKMTRIKDLCYTVPTMAEKKRTIQGQGSATGWRISDSLKDEFQQWCDRHRRFYEDECAKAIFAWTRLPGQIQEWVENSMAGDEEYGASFWRVVEETCDEAVHELKKQLRRESSKSEI